MTLRRCLLCLSEFMVIAMALASCTSSTLSTPSTNETEASTTWRMQSVWDNEVLVLGQLANNISDQVSNRSSGQLTIKLFQPGAIVPSLKAFDAVASGKVDAAFTAAGYATGQIPAMAFFSAVPFGAEGLDQYAWVTTGEGRQLYDEFYSRLGVKALPCGMDGPEGGGWFQKPIQAPTDFQGLNMRFFGLGWRVMEKLGAKTQLLASRDIYPALKKGVIDATEFSTPYHDEPHKFYQLAAFYYYPGWHQSHTLVDLIVNPDQWRQLSPELQAIITDVCDANMHQGYQLNKTLVTPALARLTAKGVNIAPFPPSVIAAARKAYAEVVAEQSRKDPDFSRVAEAYQRFLDRDRI